VVINPAVRWGFRASVDDTRRVVVSLRLNEKIKDESSGRFSMIPSKGVAESQRL